MQPSELVKSNSNEFWAYWLKKKPMQYRSRTVLLCPTDAKDAGKRLSKVLGKWVQA